MHLMSSFRKSLRPISLLLTTGLFFALLSAPSIVHAFSQSSSFNSAAVFTIESLSFTATDVSNHVIHNDNLEKLTGEGTLDAGLASLNQRLSDAMPIVLVDTDITDPTPDLEAPGLGNGCDGGQTIKLERKNGDEWLLTDLHVGANGNCVDLLQDKNIKFYDSSPAEANIAFAFIDSETISMVDSVGSSSYGLFQQNDPAFPNTFYSEREGQSIEVLNPGTGGTSSLQLSAGLTLDFSDSSVGSDPKVALLSSTGEPTAIVGSVGGPNGGATAGNVDSARTCDSEGGEFSFLLCPILRGINEGIEQLDQEIVQSLEVKDDYYESDRTRAIWGRIRDIAYILLIPILLIMVISTALGFQFVDAYTVKRAMPRLLAAVIFMALSYDIGVLLIEISNGVGAGIGGIIAAPFGGVDNLQLQDIFEVSGENDVTALFIGGPLAAIGALTALSAGILGSYLLVFALTLVIIFALLAMRELLIIALLILGPLAILSWIFPGNDKLWKLWWGSFSKLVMIYPIIVGMIVTGRAFAALVNESVASVPTGPIEGMFFVIVKLTAYIGPYFFILALFKFAGGAFSNLAGMVNDRGKGVFDRQKKYRSEKRGQLRKDTLAGNRFKGARKGSIGDRINKRGLNAGARIDAVKAGGVKNAYGVGARGAVEAAKERKARDEAKHAAENLQLQAELKNDDFATMLQMIMAGEDEQTVKDYLRSKDYSAPSVEKSYAQADAFQREYGSHALAGMTVTAKAASKTSYTGGISEMLEDIKALADNDEALAMKMLGEASAAAAAAGRNDLGGGSYGEKAGMLKSLMRGGSSVEYTDEQGETGTVSYESAQYVNDRQNQKVLDSLTTYDMARLHPTAAKNISQSYQTMTTNAAAAVQSAKTPEEREAAMRALGQVTASFQKFKMDAATSGSSEVARVVANASNEEFKDISLEIDGQRIQTTDQLVEYAQQASQASQPRPSRDAEGRIEYEVDGRVKMTKSQLPDDSEAFAKGFESVNPRAALGLSTEDQIRMREEQENNNQ